MSATTCAFLSMGLALGIVVGVWDAAALRLENPASFPPGAAAALLAAAISLCGGLGCIGGLVCAAIARVLVVVTPGNCLALGLGLWVFAWVGVRVHVRWFFGEPLLSLASVGANLVLLVGCLALARIAAGRARDLETIAAHRLVLTVGLLVVAAATWFAAAHARGSASELARPARAVAGRDVLFVTLDTTRMDHLSAFGYPRGTTPAIDRLARRGACDVLWVPVPLTNPSHVSMLTGLSPRAHGVLNNGTALSDTIPTIADRLASAGWTCGAFVSGIPLKAGLSGLAGPFEKYDDSFSALERFHPMMTSLAVVRVADRVFPGDLLERRAARTVDAALAWLERAQRPRFLWVHLFDPHTPYCAPHALVARFNKESPGWLANGRPATEWPVADYDAELRETDRALTRLLREFEALTPAGVVAIAADHGEGLLQHGELTHGALLHEEDLRIGWVVGALDGADASAAARLRGERPPRPATDVAAILEALARGQPVPASDRMMLRADTFPPEGRGRKTATLGLLPDGGIGKTIVDWQLGERVAYRIDVDPGERHALDPVGPEWAALLPADAESVATGPLDPDVERRLRALGYIH